MTFLLTIRALLRTWGLRLGLIKPRYYERDAHLADVINRICISREIDGAFIVAVETKQAMVQILSYMKKNGISAVAVWNDELGQFHRLNLRGALACMEVAPYKYQVYVMPRGSAVSGWFAPKEYQQAWGRVNLLTTFNPSIDWKTQFMGRVRRAYE